MTTTWSSRQYIYIVGAIVLLVLVWTVPTRVSSEDVRGLLSNIKGGHGTSESSSTNPEIDSPAIHDPLELGADFQTDDALPNQPGAVATPPAADEKPEENPDENLLSFHEFFQDDLSLPQPQFTDFHQLQKYQPHNYHGPGRPAFAVYLSTRNGSIHDPFFLAAQQVAYRLLWDPRSKSQYPFVAFVAPFIPEEQRELLAAAGALVRELDLVPWHPKVLTNGRWRDLFSKLNVWDQTDFSRIALLDVDAFPLENIDGMFDQAPKQFCNRTLLTDSELVAADETCEYVFAGVAPNGGSSTEINGGVLVLEPSAIMHRRLMQEMLKGDFDGHTAEQSFLNQFFRQEGPFPAHLMDRTWNGFVPQENEEGKLKVFHDKLWKINEWLDRDLSWAETWFNDTWDDMLSLYDSSRFETLRAADGKRLY